MRVRCLALALVCSVWFGGGLAGCGSTTVAPAVRAAAPVPSAAVHRADFPLRVGPSSRYLVDRSGRPFLIVGDSPQSLLVNLSPRSIAGFLANRRAAGFNAVWVNLLCVTNTGGRADGTTYDGVPPFLRPGDLSTPNDAYFARADQMIRRAARDGIAVFLDPIETGGLLRVLRSNGVAKAYRYGRYLGRRYRRFANVVWFNGNDFQSWRDPSDEALVLAVARGIRASDPGHVQTVELNYKVSGSLDAARWRPLLGLDAAYTYAPTYAEVLKEYNRRDHLPVFMVEANYEGEHDYSGPRTLRRQEYWSLLSGAAGQFYGNRYTWPFVDGWRTHLDTVGSRQLAYVTRLFAHRPWFALVPDQGHKVVVSGYGTFLSDGKVDDSDYVSAARTRDGRLAMAYLPTTRTVTIDMARLTGRVRARWYDPVNGTFTAVGDSPFDNRGRRAFTPPGPNGEGAGDWVLVLTAVRQT